MKRVTLALLLAAALVFPSCNVLNDLHVEKRHYGKGFYVDYRNTDSESSAVLPAPAGNESAPVMISEAPETTEALENNATVEENAPQNSLASNPSATTEEKADNNQSSALPKEESSDFNPIKRMQQISTDAAETVKAQHEDDEALLVLILLIILAIILPPLAVLLKDGLGFHFLLNLLFWLLGFGFILIIPGGYIYLGIFGLIAIIHALLIVLEVI